MSTIISKYQNLISACREDIDLVEFIKEDMNCYRDYVNQVVETEIIIPVLRFKVDDVKDYQERVMRLDQIRRIKHERAIDACNQLNRISEKLGLPLFYEGDIQNRYAIADFCLEVVNELFLNGQQKSIRDLIEHHEFVPELKEV